MQFQPNHLRENQAADQGRRENNKRTVALASNPSNRGGDAILISPKTDTSSTAVGSPSAPSKISEQERQKMTDAIVLRLERKPINGISQDRETMKRFAKRLEEILYKADARSGRRYADVSTLDARLHTILITKLNRRLADKAKRNRSVALRKVLGRDRFMKAQVLVREIRQDMNRTVSQMGCCGGNGSTACAMRAQRCDSEDHNNNNSSSKNCAQQPQPTFRDRLPGPVRDLFFNTRLIRSFELSPIGDLHRLPWDEMIETASNNLIRFRECMMDRTNKASGAEQRPATATTSKSVTSLLEELSMTTSFDTHEESVTM